MNSIGVTSEDESTINVGEKTRLQQLYREMAHRVEMCSDGNCRDSAKYTWHKPVSFHVTVSQDMRDRLTVIDRALQQFTSFSTQATNGALKFASDESNVFIYVGGNKMLEAVKNSLPPLERTFFADLSEAAKEGCFASISIEDEEILKSVIFAPDRFTDTKIEKCLLEELYNSTGLFGDPIGYASVFDVFELQPSYEYAPYTHEMFQLLKMHYANN